MASTATSLKPGDRVVVPWGLTELVGTVIEVYGPRARRSVLVEVPVEGAEREVLALTRVSYPASGVHLAPA
ncbi:MAG: hypothetical protein ACYCSJ_12115 [Acidimicrobiales bacterium]|jgi:hypothetical protein